MEGSGFERFLRSFGGFIFFKKVSVGFFGEGVGGGGRVLGVSGVECFFWGRGGFFFLKLFEFFFTKNFMLVDVFF